MGWNGQTLQTELIFFQQWVFYSADCERFSADKEQTLSMENCAPKWKIGSALRPILPSTLPSTLRSVYRWLLILCRTEPGLPSYSVFPFPCQSELAKQLLR